MHGRVFIMYDESGDEYDPKKDKQGSSDSEEEERLTKSKPKTSKPAKWTKQEKEVIKHLVPLVSISKKHLGRKKY